MTATGDERSPRAIAGGPDAVLGLLMLAWDGETVPAWVRARNVEAPPAGYTLFRHHNVRSPEQLRALTDELQADAPDGLPFLIAADQEGGQFQALGDGPTQFPGAMALGATGDAALAEAVGRATGTELAAMGVNVCYAPVADVAVTERNPALGIRSFGSEPAAVAAMVAATVTGIRSAGVAATVKHFPGAGGVETDTHHALGLLGHDRARLDAVDLVPFGAAVDAGVDLVMSGHFAVPGVTGSEDLPATLALEVMDGLLRRDLGFAGVTITDALDMKALEQGPNQVLDVLAALRAGVDLLLLAIDPEGRDRVTAGLRHASRRGLVDLGGLERSLARVERLRRRVGELSTRRPELSVVGCAEHVALARSVAGRSVTLVRDDAGLLPLRVGPGSRILAVMPRPTDLTPADTSSTVAPGLAAALRTRHDAVDELIVDPEPSPAEIAAVRERAAGADVTVIGTIAAHAGSPQAALVEAVLDTGRPVVTVALRTPWDLLAYPAAATHLCTYSILPHSLEALARHPARPRRLGWSAAGAPGLDRPRRTPSVSGTLLLRNGRVVEPGRSVGAATDVLVVEGRIEALGPEAGSAAASAHASAIDLDGRWLAPGYIDLQVNGAAGHDITANPASIWAVGEALAPTGVTAWVPTIVTAPPGTVERAQEVVAAGPPAGYRGAIPLGLHVEGPFLSPERNGAHDPGLLRDPDPAFVAGWSPESGVVMVTIAPELPGALGLIADLVGRGVVVSLGHSAATFEQGRAGIDAGATYATHLFNAMPPLGHREPGLAAAVLADERMVVGTIPDGIHVHPAMLALAWRLVGSERLSVVTDAIAALGMPHGTFRLGGMDVTVDATGPRLADGRLAGSVLTLDAAVRAVAAATGCAPATAIAAVTTVPARVLGLADRGCVAPGFRGDLTVLTPHLEVAGTVINGELAMVGAWG